MTLVYEEANVKMDHYHVVILVVLVVANNLVELGNGEVATAVLLNVESVVSEMVVVEVV